MDEKDDKEKPWWSEVVKDVTLTGLATIFMTEEGVRNYLKEKKLPKEMVGQLIEGFGKKKDGFYEMLTREFGKMLSKVDLSKELEKFLENHEISVQAKVNFSKKVKDEESSLNS